MSAEHFAVLMPKERFPVRDQEPLHRFYRSVLADRQLTRNVNGVLRAIAQPSALHQVIAVEAGAGRGIIVGVDPGE